MKKIITAAIMVTMGMMLAGCPDKDPIPEVSRFIRPTVASAAQVAPAQCLTEAHSVPTACREWLVLPVCLAEDDAIDGTAGPECWWISNEGQTWYNDGSGVKES